MKHQPKPTVRQHWLPAGYLAGFTLNGDRYSPFWIHPLDGSSVREDIPNHVGFENHYHDIDIPGFSPDHLERIFQDIEGPAFKLFKTLAANPGRSLLSESEKDTAIGFFALQAARVPQSRDKHKKLVLDSGSAFMKELVHSPEFFHRVIASGVRQGIVSDPVEQGWLREAVDSGEITVHADKTQLAVSILRLADAILEQLEGMHYTLWYAEEPDYFVCSDYPVGIFYSISSGDVLENPGSLENPIVQLLASTIYMPLGRSVALVIHGLANVPTVQRANQRMVGVVNAITISSAERFICSPTRDFACTLPGGRLGNAQDALTTALSFHQVG